MIFENVCIESVAHHLPERVVSSVDLENKLSSVYEKLKLNYGRLELFTGIKERRFWDGVAYPSETAIIAAQKALQKIQIKKEDIGCLVYTSVCRDFLEPATASIVHEKLQLHEDALIFDISNACLGFLNGMVIVAQMIETKMIDHGIIVGGEDGGTLVESNIRFLLNNKEITKKILKTAFATLTIGSGAAAMVLSHKKVSKHNHHLIGDHSKLTRTTIIFASEVKRIKRTPGFLLVRSY